MNTAVLALDHSTPAAVTTASTRVGTAPTIWRRTKVGVTARSIVPIAERPVKLTVRAIRRPGAPLPIVQNSLATAHYLAAVHHTASDTDGLVSESLGTFPLAPDMQRLGLTRSLRPVVKWG